MSTSSFARLRADAIACLLAIGAPGTVKLRRLILVPSEGEPLEIPCFDPPAMDEVEREIVASIERAGKPLQQKEIAAAADLSPRSVERTTPRLVDRGLLIRHPTLGFYLPGMQVEGVK